MKKLILAFLFYISCGSAHAQSTFANASFPSSVLTGGIAPFALTSAGYTVPANLSLVRLNQASTVATATITLPSITTDGYSVTFDNYTAAVTALTFSPAVNGWTNGTTMAAASAVRIRWDNFTSTWQREQ